MIIRWSAFFPRLILLALAGVAVWLVRDMLIGQSIRHLASRQTGAAATVGSVQSDPASGIVQINDLALYDAKSPHRELFRAERIVAKGDNRDLALRFLRFPEVQIQGIRIVVDGTDGKELMPDQIWSNFKDRLPTIQGDLDWTGLLTGDPKTAANALLKQLETSRLAEEMKKRWPLEVAAFKKLGDSVKSRFDKIKEVSSQSGQTPDKLAVVQQILTELESADQGAGQLLTTLAQLKERALQDYKTLVDASKRDQDHLKNLKTPDIGSAQLAETFVGPEIKEQWNRSITWGKWARSLIVPPELEENGPTIQERFGLKPPRPQRGERIHFAAQDAGPELLLETTTLTGQILFGTLPVYFSGVAKNIAEPMTLGKEPIVAQFCFSGSGIPSSPILPVGNDIVTEQVPAVLNPSIVPNTYVTLQVDRTGERNEDQLIICCPMYQLSERTLGKEGKLAIAVSPGTSRLDGVILFQGEKVNGQIRIFQNNVRLTPSLDVALQQSPLDRLLHETLGKLNQFVAEIHVSGTTANPTYTLKSNIAEQLRPQVELMLSGEWDSIRKSVEQALATEANSAITTLNISQNSLDPIINDTNTQRTALEQQINQLMELPLDQLIQSQRSKLSAQDQKRLNDLVNSPLVQSLLKPNPPQSGQSETSQPQVDQFIQHGVDKLQEKIPGLLDKLKKKKISPPVEP